MDIELGGLVLRDSPRPIEDWSAVSDGELHYWHFIGDVTFRIGDADFSAHWGWVPVFDFAAALRGIVAALKPGFEENFEFTENDDHIWFRRTDDLVTVWTSYVDDVATVPHDELLSATSTFLDDLARELLRKHPSLGRHKHFTDLVFGAE